MIQTNLAGSEFLKLLLGHRHLLLGCQNLHFTMIMVLFWICLGRKIALESVKWVANKHRLRTPDVGLACYLTQTNR